MEPDIAVHEVGRLRAPVAVALRSLRDDATTRTVANMLWPSAVILARWLCHHPYLLDNKDVVEIGAGLGLVGLAAAHFAARVLLTDVCPLLACDDLSDAG